METCGNCRWWANVDTESSGLGECHRYPPRMATDMVIEIGIPHWDTVRPQDGGWPLTFEDDFCGEWAGK